MSEDFSRQTLRMLQVDFDKADADKSDCLSKDELVKVLVDNGVSECSAKDIFDSVDKDNDAKISRNEFINAMKQTPQLSMREWVFRSTFKKVDKDRNGFLTKEEILAAGKADARVNISDENIQKLLSFLETDQDGKIDYEEFLRVFGMEETATLMGQIFKNLDDSNDGTLSKKEMTDAIDKCHELKINEKKILAILETFGDDPNKKINYREFCELWMAGISKKK